MSLLIDGVVGFLYEEKEKRMKKLKVLILVASVSVFISTQVFGTPTQYTDLASFETAVGEPQHFIDFETDDDGDPMSPGLISGDEWQDWHILFAPVEDGASLSLNNSAYVSPDLSLIASGERTSYQITFIEPVESFGLYFVDSDYNSDTEQIVLMDIDDNTLGVFSPIPLSPANTNVFRGYKSDTRIKNVFIIEDDDGEAVLLDNVMYTIPEPATLGLLLLAGLALLRRRRM